MNLHLKYARWVERPPKFVKATRRFHCGAEGCEAAFKSLDELDRHYEAEHAM